MKAFFSKLSQAFMLPIALLPAAGIMLGIGASFSNPQTIEAYGLESFLGDGTPLNVFFSIMSAAGDIVFANLPLLFALAVAIGFAKAEKGAAALAAAISYLVMNAAMGQTVSKLGWVHDDGLFYYFNQGNGIQGMVTSVLGIDNTLSMGVFGGILVGAITVILHNKYYNVKLPDFLGFFSGPRFVPIIASFAALFYGIILVFVWPIPGQLLTQIGLFLGHLSDVGLGFIASLIFGLVERSLVPLGLHHVFYLPLWQTSVGGVADFGGDIGEIYGTQNIFFASLASGDWTQFTSTNFMTGKFPFMMFGLPAAAFAMYRLADLENKKVAGGLLFSVGFTSFLTGITEPLEFTFLFLAPLLYYAVHVPLCGISFMLMDLLDVRVGQTFSGGFIDFTLFGLLPGTLGGVDNNWYFIILVGLVFALVYYFVFHFWIVRFDLPTPGRGGAMVKTMSKAEYNELKNDSSSVMSNEIINALGGKDNIVDVANCITRLRVTVKDEKLVKPNEYWVSHLGAAGLVINGKAIQAIYGAQAATYREEINQILGLE